MEPTTPEMVDFSTYAIHGITALQDQFLSFVPALFGMAVLITGAFIGLSMLKRGLKAAK